MTLVLHSHPLSSFHMKVAMAFYETGTSFELVRVDFGDEASRAAHLALWPMGKIPVLRDNGRDRTVPETSIIIEYLDLHYPGKVRLNPADPDLARQTRLRDRFYDLYVQQPMQKIVGDRLRPEGGKDAIGVEEARRQLRGAYAMIDEEMATRTWAMGDDLTMADCAAAPALHYARRVEPFGDGQASLIAYCKRLLARPSFVRVLNDAEPYAHMFPT